MLLARGRAVPSAPWVISLPGLCALSNLSQGAADDDETGPDGVPSFKEWELPAREFHGQWESLHYDIDIKSRLLR